MSSALEHEDLENVALVRMEDVQPSRDRINRSLGIQSIQSPPSDDEEIFETCIIDKLEYENECEINDDSDSNIGSMVSIQSEEMVEEEEEESENEELIVPEVLDAPIEINVPRLTEVRMQVKPSQSDSWPTLEILPGGVIKNSIDCETFPAKMEDKPPGKGEMMYACAKCSQVFKYLFCLVKHVKWHEDQTKVMNAPHIRKLTPLENELILIKQERNELDKKYKMEKVDVLARIAAAIGKIHSAKIKFNK